MGAQGPVFRAQDPVAAAIVAIKAFKLDVSPELPTVLGVPMFFEQIYANLITNALKYNEQPNIEIAVGCERPSGFLFPDRRPQGCLERAFGSRRGG